VSFSIMDQHVAIAVFSYGISPTQYYE